MNISNLDLTVILVYLLVVMTVGFMLGRNEKVEGFFVNNRKTKLFLLIFTAISTSVGATSVLGVASTAYTSGISYGLTFVGISLTGWFFMAWLAPRIKVWSDQTGSYTLGDYFVSRYSKRTRTVGSLMTLTGYFLFTAIQFVAFARLAEVAIGVNFHIALVVTAIFTISYTVAAGIKGDFYTDAIQFFVMFPIFILLISIGLSKIGFTELFANLPVGHLNIFNYAGPSFFIGGIVFGFPLILVSMEVWQRVFASTDGKTARKAFIYSGLLKILVIGASAIIGLMALKLLPRIEGDSALFALMLELLPTGLLGLGFASILAILMSTVDSMLIVGSATLTKDYYLPRHPDATEKQILFMGRIYTALFGLCGFLVALLFQDIVRLAVTSAQILGMFGPALIGGLVWQKASERGAFWSILLGLIITLVLLPLMPDTAAIPGIIVATIVYISVSIRQSMADEFATPLSLS